MDLYRDKYTDGAINKYGINTKKFSTRLISSLLKKNPSYYYNIKFLICNGEFSLSQTRDLVQSIFLAISKKFNSFPPLAFLQLVFKNSKIDFENQGKNIKKT